MTPASWSGVFTIPELRTIAAALQSAAGRGTFGVDPASMVDLFVQAVALTEAGQRALESMGAVVTVPATDRRLCSGALVRFTPPGAARPVCVRISLVYESSVPTFGGDTPDVIVQGRRETVGGEPIARARVRSWRLPAAAMVDVIRPGRR